MISHFNGGNLPWPHTTSESYLAQDGIDWTEVPGWDGWLPDVTRCVPFTRAVAASRLLTHCGANPIIAAAAVQRAWLAERRPRSWFGEPPQAGSTVPGASDAFVADVRRTLGRAAGGEGSHA